MRSFLLLVQCTQMCQSHPQLWAYLCKDQMLVLLKASTSLSKTILTVGYWRGSCFTMDARVKYDGDGNVYQGVALKRYDATTLSYCPSEALADLERLTEKMRELLEWSDRDLLRALLVFLETQSWMKGTSVEAKVIVTHHWLASRPWICHFLLLPIIMTGKPILSPDSMWRRYMQLEVVDITLDQTVFEVTTTITDGQNWPLDPCCACMCGVITNVAIVQILELSECHRSFLRLSGEFKRGYKKFN